MYLSTKRCFVINNIMDDHKLILISELISDKKRKEQELTFYEAELRKLLLRLSLIRHEINTTETTIKLIHEEQIVDLAKYIKKET